MLFHAVGGNTLGKEERGELYHLRGFNILKNQLPRGWDMKNHKRCIVEYIIWNDTCSISLIIYFIGKGMGGGSKKQGGLLRYLTSQFTGFGELPRHMVLVKE